MEFKITQGWMSMKMFRSKRKFFDKKAYKKEYFAIRSQWLKFSEEHLKDYPNRKDRYNAFLRSLPKQVPYTNEELLSEIKKCNLAIPITVLIAMGNERNWLCKAGRRYKSVHVFATVMNGLYLQKMRKEGFEYQERLFDIIN